MSDYQCYHLAYTYSLKQAIGYLKKGNLSQFEFDGDCINIYPTPTELFYDGISIAAPDGTVSQETAARVIDVLEHLEECVTGAYGWFSRLGPQYNELLSPAEKQSAAQALETVYLLYRIDFGQTGWGHDPKPDRDGFTVSFTTDQRGCFCADIISVKLSYADRRPFAIEQWVEYFG